MREARSIFLSPNWVNIIKLRLWQNFEAVVWLRSPFSCFPEFSKTMTFLLKRHHNFLASLLLVAHGSRQPEKEFSIKGDPLKLVFKVDKFTMDLSVWKG